MAQLSAELEEWLLRAATGSRRAILPHAVVDALVAAGLGDRDARGGLDVNAAGRQYLERKDLRPARHVKVHRRR